MILEDRLGQDADAFYATLIDAHKGLSDAESQALNARLVLMLANEIGDIEQLAAIIEEARRLSRRGG